MLLPAEPCSWPLVCLKLLCRHYLILSDHYFKNKMSMLLQNSDLVKHFFPGLSSILQNQSSKSQLWDGERLVACLLCNQEDWSLDSYTYVQVYPHTWTHTHRTQKYRKYNFSIGSILEYYIICILVWVFSSRFWCIFYFLKCGYCRNHSFHVKTKLSKRGSHMLLQTLNM